MIIGVISDTHGTLPLKAAAAMAECDHIIHAGDICDPGILRELRAYGPVTAVLGNNDYDEYGPDVRRFCKTTLGGLRFLVAHYPQDVEIGPFGNRAVSPGDPIPQVCVHGHTHVPRILTGRDARPANLLLCPGSASRPRGGFPASVAKIVVEDGRVTDAWVESLRDGTILMRMND
ncbi:MAG: metallophosphoesterase family protein [Coriobacteriia bacterium]|nr:metallophosphoesterase family protein [Coriobacteriia bacterium]